MISRNEDRFHSETILPERGLSRSLRVAWTILRTIASAFCFESLSIYFATSWISAFARVDQINR